MKDSQYKILDFLDKWPGHSLKQIAHINRMSTAQPHIQRLIGEGWVTRYPGRDILTNRKVRLHRLTPAGKLVLDIERERREKRDGPRHLWDRRFKRPQL